MKSPFTELAERWSRYPIIWSPHVSSNGAWLAWSWTGLADTANVWIVPTDGRAAPVQLTRGHDHFSVNGIDATGGRLIVSQNCGGNEHDQLLLLTRENGELLPLTPEQSHYYVFGGSFHHDGRSILYTADFDYESGKVTDGSWLYVHDLMSAKRRVIARAHSVMMRGGVSPCASQASASGCTMLLA